MKLLLIRDYDNSNETAGKLYFRSALNKKIKYLHTLEDQKQITKVHGETRIPSGTYNITSKQEGGFYNRYLLHKDEKIRELTKEFGILQINDIPGFTNVLIHIGNYDEDTKGCLLIGLTTNNFSMDTGFISNSTEAYKFLLEEIGIVLYRPEPVQIQIMDFDILIDKVL
jgi:hypothetical protein